ncbi:hypothetical protein V4U94_004413 [Candida albicans]
MSPIAILDNYGNIQNELATIIPIPKKITMLSDEIIGKILDYVNQIDIINLSSTNKSFGRICQRKLMENIYVCDTPNNNNNTCIQIPKNWYHPIYMNYTIVKPKNFDKLITYTHNINSIEKICFSSSNQSEISNDLFRKMVYRSSNCFVYAIADLFRDEPVCWMTVPQPISNPVLLLDVNNIGDLSRLPVNRIKELTINCCNFQNFNKDIQHLSQNETNLKKLKLIDPPPPPSCFQLDHKPMNISELYLEFKNHRFNRNVLKNFNLRKIKKLNIFNHNNNKLPFEDLSINAQDFECLESINVNFSGTKFLQFIKQLPPNTLKEIRICDSYHKVKYFLDTLLHHNESLISIIICPFHKRGYFIDYINSDKCYFLKSLDVTQFPKLNYIFEKSVMLAVVRQDGLKPKLEPIRFHPN